MSRSEKMRAYWADPENRAKQRAKLNSPEVQAKRAAVWTLEKRQLHAQILATRTIKSIRRLPPEILPDEDELYRYLKGKGFKREEVVQMVIDHRKVPKQLELFDE